MNLRKDHYHTHTHACDFCWHVILRGRHAGLGWATVGGCGRGKVFRSLPRSGHGRSRRSLGAGGRREVPPAAPEGWHAMGFLVAPRTMDTPVTRLKLCLPVGSGRHHTLSTLLHTLCNQFISKGRFATRTRFCASSPVAGWTAEGAERARGPSQKTILPRKLSAVDVLALATMKNAAKCDT